jgi:hypothetical protein
VWTANQVSDTSRYVANVTPLIKDPAIQNALTDKITNQIVTRIDERSRAPATGTTAHGARIPTTAYPFPAFSSVSRKEDRPPGRTSTPGAPPGPRPSPRHAQNPARKRPKNGHTSHLTPTRFFRDVK